MRDHPNLWVILITNQLIALVVLLCIFGFPNYAALSRETLIIVLCAGVVWTVGPVFETAANKYLDVAINETLSGLRYILLTIVGIFFFSESFTTLDTVGAALIVLSVFLIAEIQSLEFNIGALLKIAAILITTVAHSFDKFLTASVSPGFIATNGFLMAAIINTVLYRKHLKEIPYELKRSKGLIILAPLILVGAYYFTLVAYAQGELTTVSAIKQCSPVLSFLLAYLILRERRKGLRRVISVLICVLGAFLVAI